MKPTHITLIRDASNASHVIGTLLVDGSHAGMLYLPRDAFAFIGAGLKMAAGYSKGQFVVAVNLPPGPQDAPEPSGGYQDTTPTPQMAQSGPVGGSGAIVDRSDND